MNTVHGQTGGNSFQILEKLGTDLCNSNVVVILLGVSCDAILECRRFAHSCFTREQFRGKVFAAIDVILELYP